MKNFPTDKEVLEVLHTYKGLHRALATDPEWQLTIKDEVMKITNIIEKEEIPTETPEEIAERVGKLLIEPSKVMQQKFNMSDEHIDIINRQTVKEVMMAIRDILKILYVNKIMKEMLGIVKEEKCDCPNCSCEKSSTIVDEKGNLKDENNI